MRNVVFRITWTSHFLAGRYAYIQLANFLVAVLVLYDLLVIPLSVFDLQRHGVMQAMDISMPVFWCFDFFFTFFTGYYRKGELVTDLKQIARHYAMSWMLYDLGLIVLDWMFVVLDASVVGTASWSRSLLMLRILRLARIMRAIKLRQGFAAAQDLLHSQVWAKAVLMDFDRFCVSNFMNKSSS